MSVVDHARQIDPHRPGPGQPRRYGIEHAFEYGTQPHRLGTGGGSRVHDSVLLLGHGLRPEARPDPLSLQLLESAISQYAQRMQTAPVDARAGEAPEPLLTVLAAAGLPTTDEAPSCAAP